MKSCVSYTYGFWRTENSRRFNYLSDDGQTRGIYPSWGKVYAKGLKNIDDYEIGDWILIQTWKMDKKCSLRTRRRRFRSKNGRSRKYSCLEQ